VEGSKRSGEKANPSGGVFRNLRRGPENRSVLMAVGITSAPPHIAAADNPIIR